ncbi:MAG: acyl-CoA dehydrogenase [Alphaproteobacteria bacterium]|nr:acyl-CoA dehydrogenase [Alphaproteobacteria bacterium]
MEPEVAAIQALTDDRAFASATEAWLDRALDRIAGTDRGRAAMHSLACRRRWEDHLCRSGWAGLGWPREYGGKALSLHRQAAFHEAHARVGAPLPVNPIGHGILAPTLLRYGDEAQRRRFLPGLLDNSTLWCQGYSEPGAGSDLASLRLRARRDGDAYRLDGQKVWTSFANIAQWCFVLARTDAEAPKHKGISFLLVDMTSPGITVRTIRQITGEDEYNEVFFDDVVVPAANRVGEENDGWRLAMAAAGFERGTYFIPRIVRLRIELEDVVRLAAERGRLDDAVLRDRIARLVCDAEVLRLHAERMLAGAISGEAPGAEGSVLKLLWSETHQRLLDLAADILGPAVQHGPQEPHGAREGRWVRDYLWTRAETILAGTSEIQRNIIAERGLGLPR